MRDSKFNQAISDICDIAQAKLGKDWAVAVMMAAAESQGFRAVRRAEFDGELAEVTFSKINVMVLDEEDVREPE